MESINLYLNKLDPNLAKTEDQLINLLKIKKILISVFPKFLCPYLIMEIRKV